MTYSKLTGVRNVIFSSQIIIDNEGEIEASQKRHLREPMRDRQTRLDAVAGTDNPYSLIALFSRGHPAIKARVAVYVTRCSQDKVVSRSHKNCTEEILALLNGNKIFCGPISSVAEPEPEHC